MCKIIRESISKNLSGKFSQKFLDSALKSAADTFKTTSKRAIQKTVEATGDVIGKWNYWQRYKGFKTSPKIVHSEEENMEIEKYQNKYINHLKKCNKLLMSVN